MYTSPSIPSSVQNRLNKKKYIFIITLKFNLFTTSIQPMIRSASKAVVCYGFFLILFNINYKLIAKIDKQYIINS